jgi:MFS transporter, FSR family, fosmidomycin resistance protein
MKAISIALDKQQISKAAGHTAYNVLFIACLCHLLNDTIQSMLPSIYPMLKSEFNLTFAQIGLITLDLQITSSIIQPLVGMYADKHHHSWQLSVGMLFTLTGIFLLSVAKTFPEILIAIALFGCGSSIFHPQASQVSQIASGGKKGLAQSIFQVGGNGGYAIGPLLAAIIILPHGLPAVRWFGVFALLAAVLLYYIGKWHVNALKTYRSSNEVHWTTAVPYSKGKILFFVTVLFILMFSKNFYTSSMTSYYTFFLIDKFGLSVASAQICLFVFLAAEAVGTIVGGMLGDKYGRKYVIWFSIFGAAPFTIMLPYVPQLWMVIVLSILIGLIIASAFSAILVYATDLMPRHTGIVAGLFYGLSFGVAGLGSALFGWVADATSIQFVFEISTLLPLIGIIAVFLPKMKQN